MIKVDEMTGETNSILINLPMQLGVFMNLIYYS